ncbi:follicle cell protein 3C-1 isoform X2 [Ptiloglossa arizonensis]|uniref:follicle cell protein 3C-1 isoform X2 n=1 Tax=Ptiloglossa arizonensis TaxID=3350558 RepID=UPI003FA0DE43
MYIIYLLLVFCFSTVFADQIKLKILNDTFDIATTQSSFSCTCGIFLNGQFKKGSKVPTENPTLIHDQSGVFPCTPSGKKLCTHKCLNTIVKYLPNSSTILCNSIERDCYKERAYLFIKNCRSEWINTNLSAGREYCCKKGAPYKCPI